MKTKYALLSAVTVGGLLLAACGMDADSGVPQGDRGTSIRVVKVDPDGSRCAIAEKPQANGGIALDCYWEWRP